jgi:hypothetical protein
MHLKVESDIESSSMLASIDEVHYKFTCGCGKPKLTVQLQMIIQSGGIQ